MEFKTILTPVDVASTVQQGHLMLAVKETEPIATIIETVDK